MDNSNKKEGRNPGSKRREGSRRSKYPCPVYLTVIADVLLACFVLLLFAYIHHGRAYLNDEKVGGGSQIIDISEKPKELQLTLTAPAANVGETVKAELSVVAPGKIQKTTIVFSYDSQKLSPDGSYAPGDGLASDAVFEFIDSEDADGMKTVTLVAEAGASGSVFAYKGTVFTMNFKVRAPLQGVTPVTIDVTDGATLKDDGKAPTMKIVNNNGDKTTTVDGDFSVIFNDKFTDGEPVQTENSYMGKNVSVTWQRYEDKSTGNFVVYYVADIYVRSTDYLKTARSAGFSDYVENMAKENNAIIAINGDYFGARRQGTVVREGQLIRESDFKDVLVLFKNGVMKTYSNSEFDLESVISAAESGGTSVLDIWSFGPALLDGEGKAKTEFDSSVTPANPRSAIGYYEPGHYCFVAVNGRGEENSAGLKMADLSKLFEDLGCTVAYNLDGGKSSVMVWDLGSKDINTPYDGGRSVSDIIYIPKD
ncbi:MAG: phosphodiester glycosidase family protein [Clostridiales bacterium]|nr:phosphodiester glycosidase family protein [Clostridiales bacterium]